MFQAFRVLSVFILSVGLWGMTDHARAQSQMFPPKPEAAGLSAYLLAPSDGVAETPNGWELRTGARWGNSALADQAYAPTRTGATLTQDFVDLPRADYTVSLLIRGEARARLAGQEEWIALKSKELGKWEWATLGSVSDTDTLGLELQSIGGGNSFYYGGVLAEGSVMPVIPVESVVQKIRGGGPATVVLLGDSVTENWLGTGGGASSFETGNAGLIKAWLQELSGQRVGYLTHRTPEAWESIDRKADPGQLPTATVDGQSVYDSRSEPDPDASLQLINLGKGGAAADWGWTRMPDTIVEHDWFDGVLPKDQRKASVRFGLAHYDPDLVVVNFGTNDVNKEHQDWTAEDYLFHMKVLATMLQHRFDAAVVLSTPHKWSQGTHLPPERQQALVDALRQYTRASGIALADVYAQYGEAAGDGIHPHDAGHRKIADAYIQALQPQ